MLLTLPRPPIEIRCPRFSGCVCRGLLFHTPLTCVGFLAKDRTIDAGGQQTDNRLGKQWGPLVGFEGVDRVFENGFIEIGEQRIVRNLVIDWRIAEQPKIHAGPIVDWRHDETDRIGAVIAHEFDRGHDGIRQTVCVAPFAFAGIGHRGQSYAAPGEVEIMLIKQIRDNAIEVPRAFACLFALIVEPGDRVRRKVGYRLIANLDQVAGH